MLVEYNEIQSFTASSAVITVEFTRINIIYRWCGNKVQPSIPQLNEIANILDVDVRTSKNYSREKED